MAYFTRPNIHVSLKTWQANIVIPVGDYVISYSGDDGNMRKDGPESIRHYLMIWHKDDSTIDLTEELGFETYGDIDLVAVIKKIESLGKKSNLLSSKERKIKFESLQIGREAGLEAGLDPFVYKKEYEAWFICFIDNIPNGGYATKEHAEVALGIWKAKPELNYQELYRISEFVYKGLQ